MRQPLFEGFWKSGAPLIGEQGATGWLNWAKANHDRSQQIDLLEVQGEIYSLYIDLLALLLKVRFWTHFSEAAPRFEQESA